MKKKKIALAYELNDEHVNECLNKLSYYKKFLDIDSLIIFYKILSNDNINLLSSICNCLFVKTTKFKKGKFEIFNYLDTYDIIIYSNVFITLTNDMINASYEHAFSVASFTTNCYVERNFKRLINKYDMFRNSNNFDFIIITNKLNNYNKISSWCKFKSIQYQSVLSNRIDGILDLMIQEFKIPVNILEETNNNEVSKKYQYEDEHDLIKSEPLVTVLMSIYDRVDYIDEAIKSILNQTYSNFEFIIILEYSKMQDKIYKKLLEFKDKRIIIVKNKKKLGFAESLNVGIKIAHGKYLARMDDDDISSIDRFLTQVKFLELNETIDVVGSHMKFFASSNLICRLPLNPDDLKVKCLYKTPLFHPTVMIRLDKLKDNNLLYHDVYAEDYDLWSRLIECMSIANIDDILYYYRLRNDNNSVKNETLMNESHHKIMKYQLEKYLNLKLSYDELQLLSGRIDVLGASSNLDIVYNKKIKLWNKIKRANQRVNFYKESSINKEIEEINDYYNKLKKLHEK